MIIRKRGRQKKRIPSIEVYVDINMVHYCPGKKWSIDCTKSKQNILYFRYAYEAPDALKHFFISFFFNLFDIFFCVSAAQMTSSQIFQCDNSHKTFKFPKQCKHTDINNEHWWKRYTFSDDINSEICQSQSSLKRMSVL